MNRKIPPIAKSFTLRQFTIIKPTNQKMVDVRFFDGKNPFKSKCIGGISLSPQLFISFISMFLKFSKENRAFFEGVKVPRDLGKLSSPDEFPSE
ncbi:hypothetical protein KJA15_02945 [Patescibacteria group bacterium]|nr:hypothetical protein [Patescibacteria group bacterium]